MASKFSIAGRKKTVLSREAALEVVLNACVEYDIDVDEIEDKKQKKQTEALLNAMLDYVMRGILEFKEDGTIVQHFVNAPGEVLSVDYKRITGQQKLVMDGKDENDRYEMMYSVLGAASGIGADGIKKLHGIDLKVAEALTIFFL